MRYLIDVDTAGTRTHVVAFDGITEHALYVLRAFDRPDPPAVYEDGNHPRRGDFFFREARRDREHGTFYKPSDERRTWWLGRTDLNGWDDIPRAVTEPWAKGTAAVDAMRERMADYTLPQPRSIRRRAEWRDDPGGTFDFDRFAGGQPAYRVTVNRHTVARQFVTLFVDACASRATDAEDMYWRGVTAVVVAEKLEAAGYSVEIVIHDVSTEAFAPNPSRGAGGYQDLIVAAWVKRFEDPIDVGAIVAASSPWYFRILMFASHHIIPGERPVKNYGLVGALDPALVEHFTDTRDARMIEEVWSERAAVRRARAILDEFAGDKPDDDTNEGEDDG